MEDKQSVRDFILNGLKFSFFCIVMSLFVINFCKLTTVFNNNILTLLPDVTVNLCQMYKKQMEMNEIFVTSINEIGNGLEGKTVLLTRNSHDFRSSKSSAQSEQRRRQFRQRILFNC